MLLGCDNLHKAKKKEKKKKKCKKKGGGCGDAENCTPDVRLEVYLSIVFANMPNRAYFRYRTGACTFMYVYIMRG